MFGIITFLILMYIDIDTLKLDDFIKEIPTIGLGVFGFLLTFLSIIIQGTSDTIVWMKSRSILYNRFINYNRGVILLSLYLTIMSMIVGYSDINLIVGKIISCSCIVNKIDLILSASILSLFAKLLSDGIRLVKIFFELTTNKK